MGHTKTKNTTYSGWSGRYNDYGYSDGLSILEKAKRNTLPYIIDEKVLVEMLEIFSPSCEEGEFISWIDNYIESLQEKDPDHIYLVEEDSFQYGKWDEKLTNLYISKYPKDYTKRQIKESIYPCIVAHTDEVHYNIKNRKIFKESVVPLSKIPESDDVSSLTLGTLVAYSKDEYETYERCGLSADDKVGVYTALHALKHLDRVKVALFASEEIGMIGSSEVDLSFFDNCAFAIQLDRRGNTDLCTKTNGVVVSRGAFTELLEDVFGPYGYSEATGTATDVGELRKQGLDISSVNISCGYRNEHTADEEINLEDMNVAVYLTMEACKEGVLDLEENAFRYEFTNFIDSSFSNYNTSYNTKWDTYDEYTDDLPIVYKKDKDTKSKSDKKSKTFSNIKDVEDPIDEISFREFCSKENDLYPKTANLKEIANNIDKLEDYELHLLTSTHLEYTITNPNCMKGNEISKVLAREFAKRAIKVTI